jgi:XTP/dITP diphosphohydrolase
LQLLFASHNQGKLTEAQQILTDTGCEVISLDQLKIAEDVEETGSTMEANAQLKAEYFAHASSLLTVADDSGLEILALDNWPGVKSHRIVDGSDAERVAFVLAKMENLADRRAQFKTVLCLVDPQTENSQFFEGLIKGKIATHPSGNAGFGYDPIFVPDGYDQPFAELGLEVKNQISHRKQALEKLKSYVISNLSTTPRNTA